MVTKAEVLSQRGKALDELNVLAGTAVLTEEQETRFKHLETEIAACDAQIERINKAHELAVKNAVAVEGQEPRRVFASAETDPYVAKDGLVVGGIMKMLGLGRGSIRLAREEAAALYGENHRVTRALNASTGSSGGFIIPPDYMNEIIELLRPMAVVRNAGPRVIPMPRGTMTLPGQATPAVASYGSEVSTISTSQQSLNQIVATYKKLTALVPVTNDMMRYADPAIDAFVRDDLVKIIALREDLAFLTGDGTSNTPRGFLSFATGYAVANGGTAGVYSVSPATTYTPATGGNFVTSNATYTLSTAASELGGLVNKLDTANVPDIKRRWFFHPRTFNYLNNVQNSLGVYVYRDELSRGTLLGYPFSKSTQIPINIYTSNSTYDGSFVFLVEMTEAMILDSMQLELAVSRDGTYIDASGTTQSAFSNDQTLIRAIAEHDFQMRHDASVAVLQYVRWAPAIS